MQESKQEPVLPYFWSLRAGQNFSIYSLWVPVSEATGANPRITVGGRHHHYICGCKYMLDCITLELVSALQFWDSFGKHGSLIVILVELLESCTDKTLYYDWAWTFHSPGGWDDTLRQQDRWTQCWFLSQTSLMPVGKLHQGFQWPLN